MPDLPNITPEQVSQLISQATDIGEAGRGGQKLVFRGTIEGNQYALKFAKLPSEISYEFATENFSTSDIAVRAKREVDTMRYCTSPHMVKLGPIGLTFHKVAGQQVLYFSEAFIDGDDLRTRLRGHGRFEADEVVKLGLHITDAIKDLWKLGKIHRDIKPANIMRHEGDGAYVLLDAGFAFDVVGDSLSLGPVGTPPYFSPEQFDFTNRRTVMDFRSDLFSLGVTMYEMATGQHPFWSRGQTSRSLYNKITEHTPESVQSIVNTFPERLDEIILRLLAKSPHLRYRRCEQLIEALVLCYVLILG